MRCMRCGRRLKQEPISGMGPVCARLTLGRKPKREKRKPVKRDELTRDLFFVGAM